MACAIRSLLMVFRATCGPAWVSPTARSKSLNHLQGMQMKSAKFDIVVYGATGFTGQLVAEYLAAHYKGDTQLRWAMAGRSMDKLKSVRDAVGAPVDTPLIAADASDPASLQAMASQTRSVLS